MMSQGILSRLDDHARSGCREGIHFLVDGEEQTRSLTFEQLRSNALYLAHGFDELGLVGQRIVLLLPTGLEFVECLFGCLYAGATPVPVAPGRSSDQGAAVRIRAIIADCKPALVVFPPQMALDDIASWKSVLETDALCLRCDELPAKTRGEWAPPVLPRPDQLAFLQYTSGSTSAPKGVMVSHGNIVANIEAMIAGIGLSIRDRFVCWLPLHHDMGLIGNLMQSVYLGCDLFLMSPLHFLQRPARWLKAIERYGATVSGGPNFAFEMCNERVTDAQVECFDLSSWRIAFNGAEPLRASTIQRFSTLFSAAGFRREAFFSCYGLAEATLFVAGEYLADPSTFQAVDLGRLTEGKVVPTPYSGRVLVRSGIVARGHDLRIVDPDRGTELEPGLIGEIWVTGPSISPGYWNRAGDLQGWGLLAGDDRTFLRTGDLGAVVEGRLFVVGRLKDLIIIKGRNFHPADLETTVADALNPRSAWATVAAAVVEDGVEQLVIVQEWRQSGPWENETGRKLFRSIAERHEVHPNRIVFVHPGTIPRTTSGKVQRQLTMARLARGELKPIGDMGGI